MAEFIIHDLMELNDEIVLPRIRIFVDLLNPFAGLSDSEIYERYRFPQFVIMEIVDLLAPQIQHQTRRSRAIPPLYQVCIGLRYLASNSFQQVVGDTIHIHKSTVCRSLWRFSKALVRHLNSYIKFPSNDELVTEKRNFYDLAQFPNVIGLIDGTHIRIVPPSVHPEVYINRKGFHSINTQAICRSDGSFSNLIAKWPGSAHDSRIFSQSNIYTLLQNGPHKGHLLGDSGYACRPFLLRPFRNARTRGQQEFDKAHRKTRVKIEQLFGRWKRRFACLHSELRVRPERCCLLIICCGILHNIAVSYNLPDIEEMPFLGENEDQIEALVANQQFQDGIRYRDHIVDEYFA